MLGAAHAEYLKSCDGAGWLDIAQALPQSHLPIPHRHGKLRG